MKRLSLIFIISLLLAVVVVPVILIAQADVTNVGVAGVISGASKIITAIKANGWKWLFTHWYSLLTTLLAAGFIIIRFTPTKKDDLFFEKWCLRPFRIIGKIMSFGMANGVPPEKK